MTLRVLDLFSGIGGFSLGLERAGMETVAFCEVEEFPRQVLAKHWPDIPIHTDIRQLDGTQYRGAVDLVCGGPPCQPASVAGVQRGSADDRWLWPEAIRIVGEVRPRWCLFENPNGITTLADGMEFEKVLSDLEAQGYEVQTLDIPACGVDAHHIRHRVWIVAHACRGGVREQSGRRSGENGTGTPRVELIGEDVADSGHPQPPGRQRGAGRSEAGQNTGHQMGNESASRSGEGSENDADTDRGRLEISGQPQHREQQRAPGSEPDRLREGRRGNGAPGYCERYGVCHDANRCDDPNDCWLERIGFDPDAADPGCRDGEARRDVETGGNLPAQRSVPAEDTERCGDVPNPSSLNGGHLDDGSAAGGRVREEGDAGERNPIPARSRSDGALPDAPDSRRGRSEGTRAGERGRQEQVGRESQPGLGGVADEFSAGMDPARWPEEPNIPRVATGIPDRAKRLKALGNAVVPQLVEVIGRAILQQDQLNRVEGQNTMNGVKEIQE